MLKNQRKLHYSGMIYGAPRQGTIADIIRRTRDKYNYAICYVKRMCETLKKLAMARAISKNNTRNYGRNLKKDEEK